MYIIKNANLMSMGNVENEMVDILVDNKVILKIGEILEADYPDAIVIDAESKLVTPGLIDCHCHVGMWEEGTKEAGQDVNEMTDPIVPHMRGIDGIKPQDIAFKEAMEAGFTTVVTGPGSGEVIAGTFCALKTVGKTVIDMCLKEEVAMKVALGENPKRCFGTKDKMPQTRMGTAAILRENLIKAQKYHEDKKKYEALLDEGKEAVAPAYDMKMESLSRVFDGLKVKIHAHQQDDIVTAIRIGEEFGLDFTIDHCTEGYLIPEILKEKEKRIIIGPTLGGRSKIELRNMSFNGGKVYEDYEIEFALMTDHPVIPLSAALVQAGIYVKHGVSFYQIMKALTINPARFSGIEDRVGSIAVGKDADIVIWSGDPLHYMTRPSLVMINGEITYRNV